MFLASLRSKHTVLSFRFVHGELFGGHWAPTKSQPGNMLVRYVHTGLEVAIAYVFNRHFIRSTNGIHRLNHCLVKLAIGAAY